MNPHIHKAGAAAWAAVLLLALTGCGGGGGSGDSSGPSAPPPPVGGTNQPPTISGTAPTSVTSGQGYSFQPTASDPDNQTLTFSIASKPSWATFDATSGRLVGTPAAGDVGTYANIVISVTDGIATASLSAFTVTVQAAAATGSVKVSWVPPTANDDGSPLTNLAGYKVRYGKTSGALNQILDVSNPGATTVTIGSLSTGTWYFTLASYTNVGVESVQTAAVSKTIS
jgi:hypothetical protein